MVLLVWRNILRWKGVPLVRIHMGGLCEEKLRLTRNYQEANARFSDAVSVLAEKTGTVPRDEYERLRQTAEQLRLDSEKARVNLERHIAQHDC